MKVWYCTACGFAQNYDDVCDACGKDKENVKEWNLT